MSFRGSIATECQLLDRVLDSLRDLPEVEVNVIEVGTTSSLNLQHDAQIDLQVGDEFTSLIVKVRDSLYPRDVREVLWQFRNCAERWHHLGKDQQIAFFLAAHSISPGAKELLRHERIGYYDSGGSLFLPARGIYVFVDKPPPENLTKSIRSIFSNRRSQVIHACLIRHRDWFGVKEISNLTNVSPATASQVLTELERLDWIVSRGKGPRKKRHLREPGSLLDEWVKQLTTMRLPPMRRYFVPPEKKVLVETLAEEFNKNEVVHAFTHESAGQRYTPFLSTITQVRCRLVGCPAVGQVLQKMDARLVDRGANLAIIEVKSSDSLLFRESIDDVWLASPIQVYLDLMIGEGRANELANHLRNERIGY